MTLPVGRGLLVLLSAALVTSTALAQPADSPEPASGEADAPPAGPIPYTQTLGGSARAIPIAPSGLSEGAALSQALIAARRGDGAGAQAYMARISDPVARKLALWAIVDVDGEQLSFYQLDQASRDLAGWPRPARRRAATEKMIATSGLDAQRIVDWFRAAPPESPQGAMALASAYEQLARRGEAGELIRKWWRTKVFEADVQRAMLTRFADLLSQDDHVARADALLYGQQGPAARDLLPLLPADQRALADARLALREDSYRANDLVANLPPSVSHAPGLAVERARYLLKHDLDTVALGLVREFPTSVATEDGAKRVWSVRKLVINAALKAGDYRAAYAAATHHGLPVGPDYAEAEFYAGWIALSKLHNPAEADFHFAHIEESGVSPITQGRALYWRGRAAEANGDGSEARDFYTQGARYYTAFYGQLAAEKAGVKQLTLGHDPSPSADDRARFEGLELARAARLLVEAGQRDLFRTFILHAAETTTREVDGALLVDLARAYGDQDLSMRAVRTLAQHGFVLPERGYPMRAVPSGAEAADPAIVFGVIRQESGFDPRVRSGVGARGMMQLMPTTAKILARRMGERYSPAMLDEPDYNIRLGATYIGGMINDFGGSYVMAAAAYNAGPRRPADWVTYCGDPRGGSSDPADFIECIPFSETRNYVMRVLEGAQVYRARLHGGVAPLTLAEDLKRGSYVYARPIAAPLTPETPVDRPDPIGALLDQ